jgi:hypothetical protein
MKIKASFMLIPAGLVMLLLLFIIGCGTTEMASTWRDRTIVIDGVDNGVEWENARYFFEKEKVTIGIMNDENNLYLRLSTYDQKLQKRLLALGFTIWFDEKGGGKKQLGIHYPLRWQGFDGSKIEGNGRAETANESGRIGILADAIPKEIELIGPGKGNRSTLSFVEAQKFGILCNIADTKENLVYELQFPLYRTDSCPYGITAKQIKALGIDFEAGKFQRPQNGNRGEGNEGRRGGISGGMGGSRGGMGGMGGGGMGGGMGRRGGMGGGGMGSPVQESLDLQVKVDLAKKTN